MPIYLYLCEECGKEIKSLHSIKEKYSFCQEILECDKSGSLKRLPSNFSTNLKQKDKDKKVGELVNEFIEDAHQEVKKEKEKLRSQEYEE